MFYLFHIEIQAEIILFVCSSHLSEGLINVVYYLSLVIKISKKKITKFTIDILIANLVAVLNKIIAFQAPNNLLVSEVVFVLKFALVLIMLAV